VEDLDRQVVTLLPKQILRLLLQDDAGPVVRIDDLVALLEVTDVDDLFLETGRSRFL
jgi:hypothetical protein